MGARELGIKQLATPDGGDGSGAEWAPRGRGLHSCRSAAKKRRGRRTGLMNENIM